MPPIQVRVAVPCRVSKLSRQDYYRWFNQPICQRDRDDTHPINAAIAIHANDPSYGYRFIADELPEHGIIASPNQVGRLYSALRDGQDAAALDPDLAGEDVVLIVD